MSDRTQELPQSDLAGQVIGGVIVEAVLSRSERSLVLLGTQSGVERPAVLKIFPTAPSDSDADKRLLAEAGALSKLRHASIVTLYSVGIYKEKFPYLLMEYVPGETLKAMLHREGAVSPVRALGIVLQIVHAVEEMHRLNLRHGNLGIHNVRIEALKGSNQDLVKLVGFGLETGTEGGDDRVWYMTPEECTGGMYSDQSDIYVCGVILYQLLTGHMPYRSDSLEGLWDEVVSEDPPPVSFIHPELSGFPQVQEILDGMLSKKPSARPQGARALRLLLTGALGEAMDRDERNGKSKGEAFPVIHTVERLVSLPRDANVHALPISHKDSALDVQPGAAASARRHARGTEVTPNAFSRRDSVVTPPQMPVAPADIARSEGSMPRLSLGLDSAMGDRPPASDSTATARTLELDIELLEWRVHDEGHFRTIANKRYALLVLYKPEGKAPTDFSDRLNVIMTSVTGPETVLVCIGPPKNPESWLPWLAARVRQFGLMAGLSVGRHFDPATRRPAAYTVRMALQAVRRAKSGEIMAGRHAVDRLGLSSLFVECGDRRPGRYSSFLRYAGLAGA